MVLCGCTASEGLEGQTVRVHSFGRRQDNVSWQIVQGLSRVQAHLRLAWRAAHLAWKALCVRDCAGAQLCAGANLRMAWRAWRAARIREGRGEGGRLQAQLDAWCADTSE